MRSVDKLKDRWLLFRYRHGKVIYYRGSKKFPTEQFELAHSFPSRKDAVKRTRFMHTPYRYFPVKACEKTIFKLKLQGVK